MSRVVKRHLLFEEGRSCGEDCLEKIVFVTKILTIVERVPKLLMVVLIVLYEAPDIVRIDQIYNALSLWVMSVV